MYMADMNFKAGAITDEMLDICRGIVNTLNEHGISENACEIEKMLTGIGQNDPIRIAFVGQYSSGKSSIISAMTGNREIKIGSDVVTDGIHDYSWGNFLLTDTPGLQNNDIHDEIANEAIRKSDVLVYCITSELFSRNTLSDFKTLAFDKGYKGKMLLVINKLNSEYAPDINALIATYEDQLNKDLAPCSLDEFPYSFIDARDYLDGLDCDDDELINDSRFNGFINNLNRMLTDKGLICKLTTPILSVKEIVEASITDTTETTEEKTMLTALSRLRRVVDRQRLKASREWDNIVLGETYTFDHEGFELVNNLGTEEFDFDIKLEELANNTIDRISRKIDAETAEFEKNLYEALDEVLESKVGQFLLKDINAEIGSIGSYDKKNGKNGAGAFLQKFGQMGVHAAEKVKPERLYDVVKFVGKKILKIKFKPWGITKAAAKLAKAAKFAGPAAEIVGVAIDIAETVKENKEAKELYELKKKARANVLDCAGEIRDAFNSQKSEYLDSIYGSACDSIEEKKSEIINGKERTSDFNSRMYTYETKLNALLTRAMG